MQMTGKEQVTFVLLLIAYIGMLVGQVIWLVRIVKNNKKKGTKKKRYRYLLIFEFAAALLGIGMAFFFDSLVGEGYMPGFYWLMHWLTSMIAGVIYLVMMSATFVTRQLFNILGSRR